MHPALRALLYRLAEEVPADRAYAGIGSRATPPEVLTQIRLAAQYLAAKGLVLRSGGAAGADAAFEDGAALGKKEIYLPWPGFNLHRSPLTSPPSGAYDIAAQHHPAWHRVGAGPAKLLARDVQQVLGACLDSPCAFVLCWTPDGATAVTSAATGGTGMAIRVAASYKIPVYNLRSIFS